MFTVLIEHDCGPTVTFGTFANSADAAAAVVQADNAGTWPEGADAVAIVDGITLVLSPDGDEWLPA